MNWHPLERGRAIDYQTSPRRIVLTLSLETVAETPGDQSLAFPLQQEARQLATGPITKRARAELKRSPAFRAFVEMRREVHTARDHQRACAARVQIS